MLAQMLAQSRLGPDQCLEFDHSVHVGEHIAGRPAKQLHDLGIEMRAPAGPGYLDGGVEVEQPYRPRDLLTSDSFWDPLGVPAREDLPERIAHLSGKTEPPGQLGRGQAM